MTAPRWRKSTRSGQQTNCVELAHTLDRIRDSKAPVGSGTLRADVVALLAVVKADVLHRW